MKRLSGRATSLRAIFALAALFGATTLPASAIANPAKISGDRERLARGEQVTYAQTEDIHGRHYVGGVAYMIIDATPEEFFQVLEDTNAWEAVLPKTKYATRIATSRNEERVELHQGNALVDATYTLHLVREPENRRVRFWLDLTRPHTIEDAWGFFRYDVVSRPGEPSRLLVSYGALVDVGPGILRELYENRLHIAMLTVPERLRAYVDRAKKVAVPA